MNDFQLQNIFSEFKNYIVRERKRENEKEHSLLATAKRYIDKKTAPKRFQGITFPSRKLRKIAKLFEKNRIVPNWIIAKHAMNRVSDNRWSKRKRVSKKDYEINQNKYNEIIKNHFKILRRVLIPFGYTLKFGKNLSQLITSGNIQK